MKDKKDCYTRIIYNYTYYLELSTYTDIYLPNTTYVSTLYTHKWNVIKMSKKYISGQPTCLIEWKKYGLSGIVSFNRSKHKSQTIIFSIST